MAEKTGGYLGRILRVDLSNEKITVEPLDDSILRKFIGGAGLGAKYLYDEVPPAVQWSDPDNRLMFFSGPFGGTRYAGSGMIAVVSKGPMTNMAGSSQANGFFGTFLKFSGFDGVIIQGAAREWKYLRIHDGTAELCDARDLLGRDTLETEDIIRDKLNHQCSVYGIGPAGENLVRYAAIFGDHGHVAAHNGLGAVMGSKRLKAIAAERGNRKIEVADPERYAAAVKEFAQNFHNMKHPLFEYGTADLVGLAKKLGWLPVKNYTTSEFPEFEKFTGESIRRNFKTKSTPCWACRKGHTCSIQIEEGPFAGFEGEEPDYEGVAAMGSLIGQTDPATTIYLCNLVDRLGMDINESGYVIAWLMECYEKGILKKSDMDGLEMDWGNSDAVMAMLKKIAHREGCGRLLAEGVKRASEKIGGEAADCAVYTMKGASPRTHDHRANWPELIDTCLSNTGTIEVTGGAPKPEELGLEPVKDPSDPVEVSGMNAKLNGKGQFLDSLPLCRFCMMDFKSPIEALNIITGWDMDIEEAIAAGRRVVNQFRAFNFRHGLTKDMEAPSVRYGSTPTDGPAEGKAIMPQWDALRRNYYEQMGWDPETGKPLPETLKKLGLDDLIPGLKGE
ncbi:MAG: aldehyde ferredoxin oxidoreductase family protein [Acidobacteria bacterium]|nr:aldehyde ferredoxin oxidoreductase family protein [Acidobacteriota bacterium]